MDKKQKSNNKSYQEKDNKYFQCAVTVLLNLEDIGKHPERITKTKPFIEKYNWEGIDYLSGKGDWKKFEKNNLTTPLNVLFAKKH